MTGLNIGWLVSRTIEEISPANQERCDQSAAVVNWEIGRGVKRMDTPMTYIGAVKFAICESSWVIVDYSTTRHDGVARVAFVAEAFDGA